jgi:hypothetical protein
MSVHHNDAAVKPSTCSLHFCKRPIVGVDRWGTYTYDGEVNDAEQRHGYGISVYTDDANERNHGVPLYIGPQGHHCRVGTILKGSYRNSLPDGPCSALFADGAIFMCNYSDGSADGPAVATFIDGSTWEGAYKADVPLDAAAAPPPLQDIAVPNTRKGEAVAEVFFAHSDVKAVLLMATSIPHSFLRALDTCITAAERAAGASRLQRQGSRAMRRLVQWEEEAANPTIEPEDRWLYQPLHATGVTAAAATVAAVARSRLLQEKAMRAVQELTDDDDERQYAAATAAAAAAASAEQAAAEAQRAHDASELARIDALVSAAESLIATPVADRVLAAADAADAAAAYIIDDLITAAATAAVTAAAAAASAAAAGGVGGATTADIPATVMAVHSSASAASPPRPLPNTHAVHVPNLVRCYIFCC